MREALRRYRIHGCCPAMRWCALVSGVGMAVLTPARNARLSQNYAVIDICLRLVSYLRIHGAGEWRMAASDEAGTSVSQVRA